MLASFVCGTHRETKVLAVHFRVMNNVFSYFLSFFHIFLSFNKHAVFFMKRDNHFKAHLPSCVFHNKPWNHNQNQAGHRKLQVLPGLGQIGHRIWSGSSFTFFSEERAILGQNSLRDHEMTDGLWAGLEAKSYHWILNFYFFQNAE